MILNKLIILAFRWTFIRVMLFYTINCELSYFFALFYSLIYCGWHRLLRYLNSDRVFQELLLVTIRRGFWTFRHLSFFVEWVHRIIRGVKAHTTKLFPIRFVGFYRRNLKWSWFKFILNFITKRYLFFGFKFSYLRLQDYFGRWYIIFSFFYDWNLIKLLLHLWH